MMSNAANEASVIVPVVRLNEAFQLQLDLEAANGCEPNSDTRSVIGLDKIWTTVIRQEAWSNRIASVVLSDASSLKRDIAGIRRSHLFQVVVFRKVGPNLSVNACKRGTCRIHNTDFMQRVFLVHDFVHKIFRGNSGPTRFRSVASPSTESHARTLLLCPTLPQISLAII